MSFEERNAVSGILAGFVSWAIMLTVLTQKSAAGLFDGPSGPQNWAQAVLWLILIGLGVAILMTIVFNIAYTAYTGEKNTAFLRDERDNQIGLRGIQATLVVLVVGIISTIIALALGAHTIFALNMVLATCALSSLASVVTKLIFYRLGF